MSETSFGKLVMAGIVGAIVPTVIGYFYVGNLSEQMSMDRPTTASIVEQMMNDRGSELQGEAGAMGAAGPQGDAGPKGDKGDTGLAGDTGAAGDVGAAGQGGVAGPQGPQGPQGERGSAGADGAVGPAGSAADVNQVVEEVIRQLRASGAIQ